MGSELEQELADALADAVFTAAGAHDARIGAGRLVLVPEMAAVPGVIAEVATQAGLTEVAVNHPALDVAVHSDPTDPTTKVVFVANPTAAPIDAVVSLAVPLSAVRELWDDREVSTDGNVIAESMAPYSIHVYRCAVTA